MPGRGPAKIRAAEPRKQKHDRRDAELILKLLVEKRFPTIWMPSKEQSDLRALVLHRHQWVRIRTRIQNDLQAIALANGLRRVPGLWSYDGQAKIAFLPLPPHASYLRSELQTMYRKMQEEIENLTEQVAEQAKQRLGAQLLFPLRLLRGLFDSRDLRSRTSQENAEASDKPHYRPVAY